MNWSTEATRARTDRGLRRSHFAAVFCVANLLFSSPTSAQVADYYRGSVVNSSLRNQPATLEFSVFARSDTATTGWLRIGPPLGGTGLTAVALSDVDSLYLVTYSLDGDTIVWASATRFGTIGGDYWIAGGRYSGQGGTWRLEPQARPSLSTLALSALFIAVAALLAVSTVAVYSCDRWWRWREAVPLIGVSDAQMRDWSSVGGWLAWIVFGNSVLMLYLLVTLGEIRDGLGGTWMLGAALDGMRPVLLIESAGHMIQILGVGTGLILIFRRSPLAPPYWVGLLTVMSGYAMYDINATSALLPSFRSVFGAEAASEFTREASQAQGRNFRVILNAAIWSLYWIRSRRVRLVFSPSRQGAISREIASPPAVPTESSYIAEGSNPGSVESPSSSVPSPPAGPQL